LVNPTDKNLTINILFKRQVRNAQPKACLAQIVDWYWDELDNSTSSPLASVELFMQYRLLQTGANTSAVDPPPKRWKCTYDPDVTIASPDYLLNLGLSGNKIDTWGSFALIDNPSLTPSGDDLPPFIPDTPQIPLIIAAGALFLIILIAMIISHATDENSPSLKC